MDGDKIKIKKNIGGIIKLPIRKYMKGIKDKIG